MEARVCRDAGPTEGLGWGQSGSESPWGHNKAVGEGGLLFSGPRPEEASTARPCGVTGCLWSGECAPSAALARLQGPGETHWRGGNWRRHRGGLVVTKHG